MDDFEALLHVVPPGNEFQITSPSEGEGHPYPLQFLVSTSDMLNIFKLSGLFNPMIDQTKMTSIELECVSGLERSVILMSDGSTVPAFIKQ